MTKHSIPGLVTSVDQIVRYYRSQSRIYDPTRWTFLFGRDELIHLASGVQQSPKSILEFGCGTGRNLLQLSRFFPGASISGIDISPDMLDVARQRCHRHGLSQVTLHSSSSFECLSERQDLIIFSYCLSMINPGSSALVRDAIGYLSDGGSVCIVDYDKTSIPIYRHFMAMNHVSLSGNLYPSMLSLLEPSYTVSRSAYFGLWEYFLLIGKPRTLNGCSSGNS